MRTEDRGSQYLNVDHSRSISHRSDQLAPRRPATQLNALAGREAEVAGVRALVVLQQVSLQISLCREKRARRVVSARLPSRLPPPTSKAFFLVSARARPDGRDGRRRRRGTAWVCGVWCVVGFLARSSIGAGGARMKTTPPGTRHQAPVRKLRRAWRSAGRRRGTRGLHAEIC